MLVSESVFVSGGLFHVLALQITIYHHHSGDALFPQAPEANLRYRKKNLKKGEPENVT